MPSLTMYISNDTFNMINDMMNDSVKKYCIEHGVSEKLVRAIITQESNFVPNSMRIENHLKKAKWYTKWIPKEYLSNDYAYCSMGYMQVLYSVAVSYGYSGHPIGLLDADISIKYGVIHFSKLLKRYKGNTEDAVSAYNQGSPAKHENGKYKNQSYVTAVMKNLSHLNIFDDIGDKTKTNIQLGSHQESGKLPQSSLRSVLHELSLRFLSLFRRK